MTETKSISINQIDSEDTYKKLLAKGMIGDNDISFVEATDTSVSLGVTGASVGDIVKVKAVDENGVPTEWESVSGDTTYKLLCEQTLTEEVNAVSWTADKDGHDFDFTGSRELILLIILPEAVKASNLYFEFGGSKNGFAFVNDVTFKYAIVKHTLLQEQNAIYKEATMLSGTTSYMWRSEGVVQRTAWLATDVTEADLKPSKLSLSNTTLAVGTKIAVLVR